MAGAFAELDFLYPTWDTGSIVLCHPRITVSAKRCIIYIRATHRPPLFLRVIGGEFHPIDRLLYPDGSLHDGYNIARGDLAEVTIRSQQQQLPMNEFVELSDCPDAIIRTELSYQVAKNKIVHR